MLETQADKVSYAIGRTIGQDLKRQEIDLRLQALSQGISDSTTGSAGAMTEAEVQQVLMAYQQERHSQQAERDKVAGEKNKAAGEAFLAENKAKEGVTTLPSGLQYKVIQDGTGKSPTVESSVTTHYKGTLIDGTEFDSSYNRGQPATFACGGVIRGWTEALLLMKEGAKWQLFIPSDLAYGPSGRPPKIGPNAALLFEIELISVQ